MRKFNTKFTPPTFLFNPFHVDSLHKFIY